MEFSDFIKDILTSAKIKQKYIDTLTSPSSLSYFTTAFTDPSYDSENNYLYFLLFNLNIFNNLNNQ